MGVRMVKLPSTFSHEVHRFNFCRTRTCTGTKSCIWHFLVFSMYLREKIYMCVWLLLDFFFVCECVGVCFVVDEQGKSTVEEKDCKLCTVTT